jgi:hypothetical protein
MRSKTYLVMFLMTMLLPASILLLSVNPTLAQAQAQAQAQPQPTLTISNGGVHNIPLKVIQRANGDIDTQDNFEILPQHVIPIQQFDDLIIRSYKDTIENVKVTDSQLNTFELQFDNEVVKQNLAVGTYLLDVIISNDKKEKLAYETILIILGPTQLITQENTQQVINNFVTTKKDNTKIIFNDIKDPEPSICYFKPNDAEECKPVDGKCPNNWPMNEAGNCHPGGKCPKGFERVDDDETGTCYSKKNTFHCPTSNAIVLDKDDCAIYEPDEPTPTPTPTPEPTPSADLKEETPIPTPSPKAEPEDEPEALDSICGGVPCTSTEKEDSTTSDPIPAQPQAEDSDKEPALKPQKEPEPEPQKEQKDKE